MIELTDTSHPPGPPVPAARLAEHLRLGSGFAEPSAEESLLELYLAAATAHVEARIGQALIARDYRLTVSAWDRAGHVVLPVGPVAALASAAFTGPGGTVALDLGEIELAPGRTRQRVSGPGGAPLPPMPAGHAADFGFTAGHGATPEEIPSDLAEAVLLLAAHFYDDRAGQAAPGLPEAVAALLARHGPVRL